MDIIISALIDSFEGVFPLSDDSYAEELQFQEALEASLILSTTPDQPSSSRHDLTSAPACKICTEEKRKSDMIQLEGCPHSFCPPALPNSSTSSQEIASVCILDRGFNSFIIVWFDLLEFLMEMSRNYNDDNF
ncbi:UNVERIFIED_CONTAM: hypothetical protein Sradi_1053100 [Sesamum radiatum]|uniref:Uncharacterized protein n=1 Tax=Sesamum radiatum TaxID=300843 RepID=A0AAW2V826_SESRA